jgi:hypothetical protein
MPAKPYLSPNAATLQPNSSSLLLRKARRSRPDEEGLHLLVLQDLHGRLLGSVALPDREERLRRHRARISRARELYQDGDYDACESVDPEILAQLTRLRQ